MRAPVALVVLLGCGGPGARPPTAPPPPANRTRTGSPARTASTTPTCVDAAHDAARRAGGPVEADAFAPDLDGDGTPDPVQRAGGGRTSTYLLYAGTPTCARFVGRIEAFMLGCRHAPGPARDLCDLYVDTWLMHGDRLRTTWAFDGSRYVSLGDGELVPGPRKGP